MSNPDEPARNDIETVRRADGVWARGANRAWLQPLDDGIIRSALRSLLGFEGWLGTSGCRVTEELALEQGYVRADFAVFSPDSLHIFEIKSDRDRLYRLPDQARAYNRVADIVTLVVGWRHAVAALRQAPWWWEIWLADPLSADGIQFVPLRAADNNPSAQRPGLARLLSRRTALALLAEVGADRGVRSKPRNVVQDRVTAEVNIDRLRSSIYTYVKALDHSAAPLWPLDDG